MKTKILIDEKDYLEIEIDNLTIAELLRNELWKDDAVKQTAWKREHPTKNPVLIIKTSGKKPKTVLSDCIARVQKLNDKILDDFKKSVK
ncbi:hypothetical protein HZA33_00475 [Candidatus Pacearchaeota archaeon]|nr:hypothetical protein [Candidatus Pacearchaeota archaeon]